MTPKPNSRRIDWTLSATPTRRGVRVFLVFFLIPTALVGICFLSIWLAVTIARGPRTPERSFTAMDFFPPPSIYPTDYEAIEGPRWAGVDSPLDMGDDNDAYAMYKPASVEYVAVLIFVFHQTHWSAARDKYQYWLLFLTGYEPVSQIDFQSERAQEWMLVCQDTTAERNWLWCAYVARYDEFVINLRAEVGPDRLSIAEFETILRAIDERAIELLGPTPIPMP